MINVHDLVGLPYRWGARPVEGATDCFMLCGEVRRRLGLPDYFQQYSWIYERWDAFSFPSAIVLRWLQRHGRLSEPVIGAVACLPSSTNGFALGTLIDEDRVLFISPGGRATVSPLGLLEVRLFMDKKINV